MTLALPFLHVDITIICRIASSLVRGALARTTTRRLGRVWRGHCLAVHGTVAWRGCSPIVWRWGHLLHVIKMMLGTRICGTCQRTVTTRAIHAAVACTTITDVRWCRIGHCLLPVRNGDQHGQWCVGLLLLNGYYWGLCRCLELQTIGRNNKRNISIR